MRLADLDPHTVGRAATDAVLARLSRLALPLSPGVMLHVGPVQDDTDLPLSPGVTPHLGPVQGDTDLGLTVASLTAWAQSGALGDWSGHEDAADALLGATETLYRAPLGDAWDASIAAACADDGPTDEDPVACALAAAWSRLRVCRGHAITGTELARLASVAPQRVRQLVASGEIAATRVRPGVDTRVEAAEARRWLAARGLRGWAAQGDG